MDRRLGVALVLGLAMMTVGANQVLAEHGAGERFVQIEVGNAPYPTVGGSLDPGADDPWTYESTVETFEIPDEYDRFYLYLTEIRTDTVKVYAMEDITAEDPEGDYVPIRNNVGGTVSTGVGLCLTVCEAKYHPGPDKPETQTAEDGTYTIKFGGVSTQTYEITGYGFPS